MALRTAILKRFQALPPRTLNALQNGFWGLIIKGSGILISLLSVPITFDYLSKTTYGVWLTLSSLTTLLALLDVGIGNGLRNRFAEAVSLQNHTLARSYLSTAYVLFGGIQLVLAVFFVGINHYIPWQRILNTDISNDELRVIALITFLSITVKLVLDLLNFTLLALQNPAKASVIQLIINALILVAVYGLSHVSPGNLTNLAIATSLIPIAVMMVSSIVLYGAGLKMYRPGLQFVSLQHNNSLLSLGYKFFVIQITVIIIFYSDNLIITQLFGPEEVAPYSVAYRYFNLAATVFAIIIAPFWSAYTEANVKQDYIWMQTIYRRLQQLWMGLAGMVIVMVFVANYAYFLWLGDRINVPILLSACMGLSVIIAAWNNVSVSVINGTGKIQLQLYSALASAVLNIPLAVFFGKYLQFGSAGVILATCIALLIGSVLSTIQAKKLIFSTAEGIWNR